MKYIAPPRLLAIYAVIVMALLTLAITSKGTASVYALMSVQFFLSIMFPTIFALSVTGLGTKTKQGSSLVIMAIVGGAIFPVIMGRVSDNSSIQFAYIVPALCLLGVLFFAIKNMKIKNVKLTAAH